MPPPATLRHLTPGASGPAAKEVEDRYPTAPPEELYRTLLESSQGLLWQCDVAGRYTFLSKAWERTLGYRLDEMLGRTFRDFQAPEARSNGAELLAGNGAGGPAMEYQITQLSKDGRAIHLLFSATAIRDGEGRVIGSLGTARDVTARKQADAYREAGREVLQILNESGTLPDSMRRVLATMRSRTGFDAVGIRLQDGDDFPYFVQEGFEDSFLRTENTLVRRDAEGGVCRGKDGKVCLECTCGLVVSGKSSPLLTSNGSFWTNDSVQLLDTPAHEDPRLNPRNQCIHHGYASVALVPIRTKDRIVGLIQLNGRRKGGFSAEGVEVLEGVAAQIGEALVRKRIEAALRESEEKLRVYQKQLQAMAFDAAVSEERERRRLATVLHDGIGQNLALMQIKLNAVQDGLTGARRAAVDETLALLHQSIADSRSVTFELSPPILYDLGIASAISWLIDELAKHQGMRVVLTDDSADKPLDDTTAALAFRAVRELLMNVFKHAKSPAAEVSLCRVGDQLEVVVADAGVGFDPAAVLPGASNGTFGLMSLREQISRLGGTVEIRSARGQGTSARVRIPLESGKGGQVDGPNRGGVEFKRMPSSIASREEFDARLGRAMNAMDQLALRLPEETACASIKRQLVAVQEWTRNGRRPSQQEKDSLNFGLLASRSLDSCDCDELVQDLCELSSYLIYLDEPTH